VPQCTSANNENTRECDATVGPPHPADASKIRFALCTCPTDQSLSLKLCRSHCLATVGQVQTWVATPSQWGTSSPQTHP
jgi:hypothetical protein